MTFKPLHIFLGTRHVGILFQYTLSHDQVINRFVADDAYAADPNAARLSTAFDAGDLPACAAFWAAVTGPALNGTLSSDPARGWLLPAFFQNLLPEGPLRAHIAEKRGCSIHDHFELLAATGSDLPGDVQARPGDLSRGDIQRLITQNNDALEMSVVAQPMDDQHDGARRRRIVSLPGLHRPLVQRQVFAVTRGKRRQLGFVHQYVSPLTACRR